MIAPGDIKYVTGLLYIDIESTSVDSSARIIELAMVKTFADREPLEFLQRFNPGVKITKEAFEVHHISDDDVASCPRFADCAEAVNLFIGASDLAGYNIRKFDLPILQSEFKRAGINFEWKHRNVVDIMVIHHKQEPRDFAACCRKYLGTAPGGLHNAMVDVKATMEVLKRQMEVHEDLPRDIKTLAAYCINRPTNAVDDDGLLILEDGKIIMNFGKYRGQSLDSVAASNLDYLQWVLNGNFTTSVKDVVAEAVNAVLEQ